MPDDNTRDDAELHEARVYFDTYCANHIGEPTWKHLRAALDAIHARDAALRDARAQEREACAKIADLYAENPPSGDDNNTRTAFDFGMDHMAGCMDTAGFIAEAIRDPSRLAAVPDPRSISDAAAERASIVAWAKREGDDDNDADSEIVDRVALSICLGLYPKCIAPERGHCGTCQYAAKAGFRVIAEAVERGDHAQPEPAQESCGECDYDPDHLYHDCRDNPGTTPELARREDEA